LKVPFLANKLYVNCKTKLQLLHMDKLRKSCLLLCYCST